MRQRMTKPIKWHVVNKNEASCQTSITKTRLYYFDPLKPHFYIVKLGLQGYTLFFLFLLNKLFRHAQIYRMNDSNLPRTPPVHRGIFADLIAKRHKYTMCLKLPPEA